MTTKPFGHPQESVRRTQTSNAAVCPYVRAFPNLAAYKQWAESVPAATVAVPLAGATDVAAGLIE